MFKPYPGFEYSEVKGEVTAGNINIRRSKDIKSNPDDIDIRISAQYPEKQFFETDLEFLKDSLLKDEYVFLVTVAGGSKCQIFDDPSYAKPPLRNIVPETIKQQAITLAKQDKLAQERLKIQEYKVKVFGWYSITDIKKVSDDYFGGNVRDKLLDLGGENLVRIQFEHPIDLCNSDYFNSYVDVQKGIVFTDELVNWNLHCMTPF